MARDCVHCPEFFGGRVGYKCVEMNRNVYLVHVFNTNYYPIYASSKSCDLFQCNVWIRAGQ